MRGIALAILVLSMSISGDLANMHGETPSSIFFAALMLLLFACIGCIITGY